MGIMRLIVYGHRHWAFQKRNVMPVINLNEEQDVVITLLVVGESD